MSSKQWASVMLRDESYLGANSYFNILKIHIMKKKLLEKLIEYGKTTTISFILLYVKSE